MIQTFALDDEQFYNSLNQDDLKHFEPIKVAAQTNFTVPLVEITGGGHPNSWYNLHIGKIYEILCYIVETDNGHINFLVKSRGDGTKTGYKSMYSMQRPTKGLDLVHGCSCKVTIGFLKREQD
ncbi:MAG: hypothetical protein JXR34_12625 [Bacteroidales bacterium]|nr:hypothetical protein [Bacteroidales bacterium]